MFAKIRSFLLYLREKRRFKYFLNSQCDIKRKDEINNLPRPTKNKIRILGNGDSLTKSLSLLDDDADYFVVSRHVVHPSYFDIKPKYYIIADPKWWTLDEGKAVTRSILEKTTWPMILFVPWRANLDFLPDSAFVKVVRLNSDPYFGSRKNQEYLYDHNLSMPVLQNVVVGAIYCSIYLNYKEIELYGVEHSWTKALVVNDNNDVCILDTHFYDKTEQKVILFKDYDKNHESWPFHDVLKAFARMFESYWELKTIAERKGISIYNCSPNSFIDAFERKL